MCAMSPRLLRPVASGFNPKSISGLAMWLDGNDASTITLVSSAVSEWKDKAANKVFAQTIANNRPTLTAINGKTALSFNGSNNTLISSEPFNVFPLSMFFVQRVVAYTNFGMTYTAGTNNDFNLRQIATNGTFQVQQPNSAATYASTFLSTSAAQLITIVYDATVANSVTYLNNTALSLSGAFSQPALAGNHWIGTRENSFPFNGFVGEILIYSRSITATERNKISQYLGKKWGIAVA